MRLLALVSVLSLGAFADEPLHFLKKGEPAPVDGVLFSAEEQRALSKRLSERDQSPGALAAALVVGLGVGAAARRRKP